MKITPKLIVKGVRYLKHYGFKEFLIRFKEKQQREDIPYEPWYEKHKATFEQLNKQKKTAQKWLEKENQAPKISIVVPLYHTPERFLREMIASVLAQSYPNWQLCLADGSDRIDETVVVEKGQKPAMCPDDGLHGVIREYIEDERICYGIVPKNLGIAGNTNAALTMADGDYIAFLDHDDVLAPDALYEAVLLMQQGCDMIYTDEDKIDAAGEHHLEPHFKPDFNEDLLRSNNYITHFLLVKRELLEQVGNLDAAFDGAQDYDFVLRCSEKAEKIGHIPKILYHWRTHQDSTAGDPFSKRYVVDAGKRAIEAHIRRMGEEAVVTPTKQIGFYMTDYQVKGNPLVSIIIPNKDEVESLKKCLASIEKSTYRNYEVIVVENNSCAQTFSYYERITSNYFEKTEESNSTSGAVKEMSSDALPGARYEGTLRGGQRICVAVWREGFNYSKLNNFGAAFARGEYLVLLNNDIEMISRDWLERMVSNCMRRSVGIVGAKLLYPDNTIQHAGIVVGIGGNVRGIAANMFVGLPRELGGYLHKANLQMNYSAVTAACLMVRKSIYEEVGGFTEALTVAFNDVDFCLRVRKAGYLIVYNPRVEAYHFESKSRGQEDTPEKLDRFQREIEYMRTNWIDILKNGDPYYNPNLSRVYTNYSLNDD